MNTESTISYIISLVRAAITETPAPFPEEEINWEFLYSFGVSSKLHSMFYFAINSFTPEEKKQIPNYDQFCDIWKKELFLDANRQSETNKISKALSSIKIDHIILKGSVSKYLYPDTSMRVMGDVDILYKPNPNAGRIMKEMGYKLINSTPKDDAYQNPISKIVFELHTSLVDKGYETEYNYLSNIWNKVKPKQAHEYVMTAEDFYLYHIIHTSKHFRHSGIGIMPFVDTWLFINAHDDLNWDYIYKELQKLRLVTFEKYSRLLVCKWFATKEDTHKEFIITPEDITEKEWEVVLLMERFVFSSLSFGSETQMEINKIVAEQKANKKVSLLSRVFPDKKTMINYYGDIIEKYPALIPLYWIRLNFSRLFISKKSLKEKKQLLDSISDERINRTTYLFSNIFE